MARRKSRKLVVKKQQVQKLETVFCCPFCGNRNVECVIDMKSKIGEAICYTCEERFATKVNALTEAVDIYSEWIDECVRANDP